MTAAVMKQVYASAPAGKGAVRRSVARTAMQRGHLVLHVSSGRMSFDVVGIVCVRGMVGRRQGGLPCMVVEKRLYVAVGETFDEAYGFSGIPGPGSYQAVYRDLQVTTCG